MEVDNFPFFIESIFREQRSYDLTLFFDIPPKVIVVNDNEYHLDIYSNYF